MQERNLTVMARLRFPGRPGSRVEKQRIHYGIDDIVDSSDPSICFIDNLQSGLQEFKELFGESEVNYSLVDCFDPKWLPSKLLLQKEYNFKLFLTVCSLQTISG